MKEKNRNDKPENDGKQLGKNLTREFRKDCNQETLHKST